MWVDSSRSRARKLFRPCQLNDAATAYGHRKEGSHCINDVAMSLHETLLDGLVTLASMNKAPCKWFTATGRPSVLTLKRNPNQRRRRRP